MSQSAVDRPSVPSPAVPAARVPGPAPATRRSRRWAALDRSALVASAAVLYSLISLVRHDRMETAAYDLGIFGQAVKAYARLDPPLVPLKGPGANLLGDHFHPIVALLAPAYRVFPRVQTLLVAQALLLAVSAAPLHRLAAERLGRSAAAAVTVAYLLSFGLQGLVVFDFHEVAFAVPLLSLVCASLLRERWGSACLFSLPLLLVKEDLFATVATVGLYLLWRGQRRLGAGLAAGAVLVGSTVLLVVIPALSSRGGYRYWDNLPGRSGGGSLGSLLAGEKLGTLALLLGVTCFLAAGSPLLVLAAPTLGWRLLSDNPMYWGHSAHYDAVLMPILFAALIDVLARLRTRHAPGAVRLVRIAPAATLAVALALLPRTPFASVARADPAAAGHRASAAAELVRRVPDGALVSASNDLAPQLVDRCMVILFPNTHPEFRPDFVLVDSTRLGGVPLPEALQRAYLDELASGRSGFVLVGQQDGFMLFRRSGR